jgi:hypothetical protein
MTKEKCGASPSSSSSSSSSSSPPPSSSSSCDQPNKLRIIINFAGKHVLFGRIVEGEEVLAMIEKVPVLAAENGKPAVDVVVANCGTLLQKC